MKRAFLQGLTANSDECVCTSTLELASAAADPVSPRRLHPAAMLGLALSFGTSGALLLSEDASWAVGIADSSRRVAESERQVPSQSLAQPASRLPASYHTADAGDSFWTIAEEYGVSVHDIKLANSIDSDDVLQTGQILRIPPIEQSVLSVPTPTSIESSGGMGGAFSADGLVSPSTKSADTAAGVVLIPANTPSASSVSTDGGQVGDAVPLQGVSAAPVPLSLPLHDEEQGVTPGLSTALTEGKPFPLIPTDAADTVTPTVAPLGSTVDALSDSDKVLATPEPFSLSLDKPWPTPETTTVAANHGSALTLPATPQATIPGPTMGRTVELGETLWSIAADYGLVTDELLEYNPSIQNPQHIHPGDIIQVPVTVAPPSFVPAQAVAPTSETTVAALVDDRSVTTDTTIDRLEQASAPPLVTAATGSTESAQLVTVPLLSRQVQPETSSDNPLSVTVQEPVVPISEASVSFPSIPVASLEATVDRTGEVSRDLLADTRLQQQWNVRDVSQDDGLESTVAEAPRSLQSLARQADQPRRTGASDATVVQGSDLDVSILAAAPVGVAPHLQAPAIPTGQTVSPDMPLLPDSGDFLPEAPDRSDGYIWPTQGVFTSGFGPRWGRMHRGIDIAGPVGTPILASASGVVVRSGWNSGGYGNLVDIRHPDGSLTRYAHNSRLLVQEGQQVRQGEQIAEMGSTGYSTGPHLHFELHLPQAGAVNPVTHLASR